MKFMFQINGEKFNDFPKFKWKYENQYFLRLVGLGVWTNDNQIYPIYKPVFEIERHSGQLRIALFARERAFSLMFQERWPMVSFEVWKTKIETRDDKLEAL